MTTKKKSLYFFCSFFYSILCAFFFTVRQPNVAVVRKRTHTVLLLLFNQSEILECRRIRSYQCLSMLSIIAYRPEILFARTYYYLIFLYFFFVLLALMQLIPYTDVEKRKKNEKQIDTRR